MNMPVDKCSESECRNINYISSLFLRILSSLQFEDQIRLTVLLEFLFPKAIYGLQTQTFVYSHMPLLSQMLIKKGCKFLYQTLLIMFHLATISVMILWLSACLSLTVVPIS